jgi:hypothetical protein
MAVLHKNNGQLLMAPPAPAISSHLVRVLSRLTLSSAEEAKLRAERYKPEDEEPVPWKREEESARCKILGDEKASCRAACVVVPPTAARREQLLVGQSRPGAEAAVASI